MPQAHPPVRGCVAEAIEPSVVCIEYTWWDSLRRLPSGEGVVS